MMDSKHISVFNDGFSHNNNNVVFNYKGGCSNGASFDSLQKPHLSRYEEDYNELETFGKGHFGKVVRCQNKLDQLEYAIKISQKKIRSKKFEFINFWLQIVQIKQTFCKRCTHCRHCRWGQKTLTL